MVQCGVGQFFCRRDDNYTIYDEDLEIHQQKRRAAAKTRKIGCTVSLFLSILGTISLILYLVLRSRTPTASYDRNDDYKLLPLIESSSAADKLPRSGNLFCWVQTSSMYHDTRALAINETWLHRCDHGQLFTSEKFNDTNIPYSTVFAGIPDDYYNLFFKSRYAFKYIYEHISKDFDWYMKADDDTYVIVENLKSYLKTLDPNEPHYLGFELKPYLKRGYNAGGAGYLLSRAALKIFAEQLYDNAIKCPDDIYEDVGIARCLANAGIYPEDTRNALGQNRFNTFSPSDIFHHRKADTKWVKYQEKPKYDAFGSDVISFHKLLPDDIRLFEILLYRTSVNRST